MKVKRFLLRYYPPGIAVEYDNASQPISSIDLLDLRSDSDTNSVVEDILQQKPHINFYLKNQLCTLIRNLKSKLLEGKYHTYHLYKVLKAHILPLTNVAFKKDGTKFITGSYDRTCKIWNTETGKLLNCLEGHTNAVFVLSFNNPYCNIIATGSFDKTARIWNSESGLCYHVLKGHDREVVCLDFSKNTSLLATGSLDSQVYLWDIETGKSIKTLIGHSREIISVWFSSREQLVLTGSFDGTARLWDYRTGRCCMVLTGHLNELSSCVFNWNSTLIATGSSDKTSCLWDPRSGIKLLLKYSC
ncbi:dynein assembly factor with WDR repeat domains 1-like isoform X1 [Centruroides sculpturatus]|uniref:dynein assembly factor with WDR repeat domains 1-like isoform X1 n=1 Tax=Centruroides sculpturatus TaxID=218467 RepID=UPI000C6CDEF5|nr:dynein assembly factor with WDR repeat domains 1-like isoform X1 [Centruroides sculpturatus]